MKYFLTSLLLFTTSIGLSQSIISGTLLDGEFNDPLPFANVVLKNASDQIFIEGITTDFDGKFTFEVTDGVYEIELSYVGYETQQITAIKIAGEKEVIVDVTLNPLSNNLDEVIVTTSQRKNSEVAILAIQKKSINLVDGLSAQSIKKLAILILPLLLKVSQEYR